MAEKKKEDKEKTSAKKNIKKTSTKKEASKKTSTKKTNVKKENKKNNSKELRNKDLKKDKEENIIRVKKKENKLVSKFNSLTLEQITFGGIIVIALLLVVLIFVSTKNTTTKDGKDIVAKLNNKVITADDLYKQLKKKYGQASCVDLIDNYILNKEYKTTDDILKSAEATVNSYKSSYGDNFTLFLQNYGFADENELKEYLVKNKKVTSITEDYIKNNLTENEMKNYYETSIKGDIKASHILISTETNDNAAPEETEKKDNEAKKKAEEIIEKLNNGEDFATLAKKYSDDKSTKDNGGDLGYFNSGDMVEEFEKAAYELDLNKYTNEPVKTTYGYHIILKTGQKDKPSYKKSIDIIKEKLTNKKMEEDQTLSVKAMIALRKKYKLSIKDKTIKKEYENYIKQAITTTTSTTNKN